MNDQELFESIKTAVKLNHGGFETATDEQIKLVWGSLPEDIKVKYLQGKKVQNANYNKPKQDLQDSPGSNKSIEPAPAFIYKYLTCEEYRIIGNIQDSLELSHNVNEVMDQVIKAASMNLVGWENITDENSVTIPFDKSKFESIITMPESQELISKQLRQMPTFDEKKSLESQPVSGMAPSVETVEE